jgi:hypothetical protein
MGLSAERFKIYRAGAEPVVDGGSNTPVLAVFSELAFQNMKSPPSNKRSTTKRSTTAPGIEALAGDRLGLL